MQDLIDLVYAPVSDNSRSRIFLKAFVDAVHADRGTFSLRDLSWEELSLNCWCGWPDDDISRYGQSFAASDPWNPGAQNVAEGDVVADSEAQPTGLSVGLGSYPSDRRPKRQRR